MCNIPAFERAFQCRVVQFAEPTDDFGAVQFTAVARNGHVVIADSLELLAVELSDSQPVYSMAA